jgi:hypothetical protein
MYYVRFKLDIHMWYERFKLDKHMWYEHFKLETNTADVNDIVSWSGV